jgi:hypothetical protein
MQVVHRGADRSDVGFGDDLVVEVVGQRPQQRHAFRGGEREVKAVHGSRAERPPAGPVEGDTVVEPRGDRFPFGKAAGNRGITQAGQLGHPAGVPGHDPRRYAGVGFGVVLAQPAAGGLAVHRGLLGLVGGLLVVGDTPPR